MNENTFRRWEVGFKLAAGIGSIIAAVFAYYTFMSEYEQRTRQPFIELTTKYYLEVVETSARIAHPKDDAEKADAVIRFNQLYTGASALVEQKEVEEAVAAMSMCIKKGQVVCDQMDLDARSLVLAGAVRKSLVEIWRLPDGEDKD